MSYYRSNPATVGELKEEIVSQCTAVSNEIICNTIKSIGHVVGCVWRAVIVSLNIYENVKYIHSLHVKSVFFAI